MGMRGGAFHGAGGPVPKRTGSIPTAHLARRTLRLFAKDKGALAVIFWVIVISSGLGVVNPIMIKVVFDSALFCGSGCPNLSKLYFYVAIMVAIPCVTSVIGVVQTYMTNRVGQHVMADLRNRLYAHLQGMSLKFFTATRTGEIQSRLTNDVAGIQTVVTDTASSILSNAVILISTVIAMFFMSWQLTVLSLALTPLFLFLTYRAGKTRRRITTETQKSRAEMTAITEETLSVSGILLTKVFGRSVSEQQRFADENRRLAGLAIRQEMVGRRLFAFIGTFFSVMPALVYLVAGWVITSGSHLGGDITPGTIVAFTTLQSRLFFPIGQMLQVSIEIQASLALFERIFEYLDMPHDIVDRADAPRVDPATTKGTIVLEDVWFRYEDPDPAALPPPGDESLPAQSAAAAATADAQPAVANGLTPVAAEPTAVAAPSLLRREWALEGLSLDVQAGQLAAVVGPSGAGKTTLSYLIPRLYDVTSGRVLLDGVDVRDVALASLSDVIAMVTQETYLFHATVRKNLLYAKPLATDDELIAAAKAAFIHDRIIELSDGYDTVVGERGYRMSGGEKQRLAIARVALKAPRVLILDEATSALDTGSERLVQAALRPLMAGRTTIAIAHRLSTILAADVIFVIDRGRLVERGTHDELLAKGGLYANLYEQQFEGGRVEALCEDGVVFADGSSPETTKTLAGENF